MIARCILLPRGRSRFSSRTRERIAILACWGWWGRGSVLVSTDSLLDCAEPLQLGVAVSVEPTKLLDLSSYLLSTKTIFRSSVRLRIICKACLKSFLIVSFTWITSLHKSDVLHATNSIISLKIAQLFTTSQTKSASSKRNSTQLSSNEINRLRGLRLIANITPPYLEWRWRKPLF